jgi:hypothetical protein
MLRSVIWRCACNLVVIVPIALHAGHAIGRSLTECAHSPEMRSHAEQTHTAPTALNSDLENDHRRRFKRRQRHSCGNGDRALSNVDW